MEAAIEDREDVDAAEDSVELKVPAAEAPGELQRAAEQGECSAERVREEQETVVEELGTIGDVDAGLVVEDGEFGEGNDGERGQAKDGPENELGVRAASSGAGVSERGS